MKTHTSNYKNQIKTFGKEIDSKITYGDIELGAEQLNSVTPHYESSIMKSVMKQLDIDSNVEIPIGTVLNYKFGIKVGNSYEYVDYGNYVVYEVEKQEDTRSWKITCYDKMLYAMKNYESLGVTYPITVKNFIVAICNYMGIGFANENDNFVNSDKEITSELYLDGDGNSLDYTFRDVLDELAQVTASVICINENDELEVRYVNNTGDYETVSGSSFTLENVDDVKDLEIELEGDTTQEGTPTPESPVPIEVVTGRQEVEVCGKNLISLPTIGRTLNGLTGSFDKNTITISGTNTKTDSNWGLLTTTNAKLPKFEAGETYTLSTDKNVSRIYFQINYYVNGTTTQKDLVSLNLTNRKSMTFTIPSDYTSVAQAFIGIEKAATTINTTFNIQLEKGSTATNFEEYKGQSYEINLGKNITNWIQGSVNTSGVYNPNDQKGICTDYIPTNNGVTYTAQKNTILGSNANMMIRLFDSSKTFLGSVSMLLSNILSNTVTLNNSNVAYVRFVQFGGNSTLTPQDAETYEIMVEKGSQATSYSQYKTPIELCKIGNYKDYIKKSSGKNLWDEDYTNILSSINLTYKPVYVGEGTFTMSSDIVRTTSNYANLFFLSGNVTSGANITANGVYKGKTVTQTSENGYVTIAYRNYENVSPVNYNAMLNEGSTALPYEPYGTNWYIEKNIGKVVLDGFESWAIASGQTLANTSYFTSDVIDGLCKNNVATLFKSNYFKPVQALWNNDEQGIQLTANTNNVRLRINTSIASSVYSFTSWLNTHNTTLYYVLSTPTYTTITDTELIEQLESIRLLEGLNNISISSANLSSPIVLTYLKELDTIDEEYLKDVNVTFGEKFGPVNSIVLSRSAESDNIYQRDETSIQQNGLCEIKIKDNQILNGNNRDEFLPQIYKKMNGFEYCLNDYVSTGITYYDLFDRYKVKIGDNYYKTIMFNDEVDVTQGLSETVHADALEESETDYTKSDKTDRKINQAYIIVDKQNQQINSVVQNINTMQNAINSQGDQIDALGTRITQSIDNITASVTTIQDTLENGVGLVKTTTVTIDDDGLTVATDTSKTTTSMTSDSFRINARGYSDPLAFFGYDEETNSTKAQMDNLTVTNYFVAGYHRTEKMNIDGEHRTGDFYIGG